jgi:putative flippase GtrA
MSARHQLPRFVVAGAVGFGVDAATLYAALAVGANYYTGRLASFVAAVVVTWLINRRWTFRAAGARPTASEFMRYLGAMALGGSVNYAVYAAIVATVPPAAWLPLAAVAAGSLAGLGVNFAAARNWVFARGVRPGGPYATNGLADRATPRGPAMRHTPWPAAAFWSTLAAGLLALKVLGLALDPQPQFFLGDSASYLHTALTGWVPRDRSYWYGALVGRIVGDTQSLTPLLIAQAAAGAATAMLAAWWSHIVFRPRRAVLCIVAVVCSVDPSQMLLERYVMTETFALLALASMLAALACVILRGQWYWMALAVLAGMAVIALRMSLLPVVAVSLLISPLLGMLARRLTLKQSALAWGVAAVVLPLAAPLVAANQSGAFLLAAWSPLLTPGDFDDPALGRRILKDVDLADRDLFAREVNLWHPSGLMQRLRDEVPDPSARDRIARQTALRVLRRDPGGVAALGWVTYLTIWDREHRRQLMRWDVGAIPRDAGFRDILASSFRLVTDELPAPTLTSRLYLTVGAWTALASLVAPALLLAAMLGRERHQVAALALLAIVAGSIVATTGLLTTLPVVRYLHPLGWTLCAGCLAAWLARAANRGRSRRHECDADRG